MAAELFRSMANVEAPVVPFKGTPAVITALRGNNVQAAFEILAPVMSPIKSGALKAAAALIEAAPDRVLWGTDWPHPNVSGDMPNDGGLVDLLFEFTDAALLQRKILVDNPARLYGF